MFEKVTNEINSGDGNGPVVLSNQKIAALAQDTIDNSGNKDINNLFDGQPDSQLQQQLDMAEIITKLNISERCKALGQAYYQLESIRDQLQLKMSKGDTHTNGITDQLKLVIGFLKHANDFSYTMEDFVKEIPVVKEEYKNLIDSKIVEDRYDPYNLSEGDIWIDDAKCDVILTEHFSELKEKEICRKCYNVYHCRSRISIIRGELLKRRQYPSGFEVKWSVVTKCNEFRVDGDGDGGNVPLPMIPDRP